SPVGLGAIKPRNYRMCVGDTINDNYGGATRGLFGYLSSVKFRSITDGTSNTIALSERVVGSLSDTTNALAWVAQGVTGYDTNPSICRAVATGGRYSDTQPIMRSDFSNMWSDGSVHCAGFATVLPPNSASCGHSSNFVDWELV